MKIHPTEKDQGILHSTLGTKRHIQHADGSYGQAQRDEGWFPESDPNVQLGTIAPKRMLLESDANTDPINCREQIVVQSLRDTE